MSYISVIKGIGARVAVKAVKYAPHILVMTGIGMTTAGTVMAVKGATKADDILEEHKEKISNIEEVKEMAERKEAIYTKQDEMKDKVQVYSQTAWKLVKSNWVPIVLYVGGVACILSGFNIINKRYIGMAASYAGLHKSYSDYRKRVVEEHGQDADFRYANGIHKESLDYTEVDENGESKDVHVEHDNVVNPNDISEYSVLFDEMYSTMWTPNPVSNMAQIKAVEEFWNQRFEPRKFVYYYEVLRDLGIWERLPEEKQKVLVDKGWVWGAGDNHISLGIIDVNKPMTSSKKDFIMGYEPSVLIEPNLDGIVATLL